MVGAAAVSSNLATSELISDESSDDVVPAPADTDDGASEALSQALQRLEQALGALESAVDAHGERLHRAAALEHEMQQMALDRSELAQSLDAAESRIAAAETRADDLAQVNREVSAGLATAIATVRGVLERNARDGEDDDGAG